MDTMSAEEKKRRTDKLVSAIPPIEWGAAAAEAVKRLRWEGHEPSPADAAPGQQALGSDKARIHSTFHDKHDGVSDDSDSDLDEDGNGLILGPDGLPELTEGSAQVVGQEELEFGEGEVNEFLDFTREMLGLSPQQYRDILDSRQKRGGKQFTDCKC